jgi:hypothetical protein
MSSKVKCFADVFEKDRPYTAMDGGLKPIETRMITGTVDKCGDLDDQFRYKRRGNMKEKYRRHKLERAAKRYEFFPPIKVIRYKNEYFVEDGNRRVATAKEAGIDYLDAYITDYIHDDDEQAMDGALARKRFEVDTGIKNIILTNEAGFRQLLRELEQFEGTAQEWKSQWFLSGCKAVERSSLPKKYPDLRTEDIYVLLSSFYFDFMGGYPENISFESLISGYIFARNIKNPRPLRFFSSALSFFCSEEGRS